MALIPLLVFILISFMRDSLSRSVLFLPSRVKYEVQSGKIFSGAPFMKLVGVFSSRTVDEYFLVLSNGIVFSFLIKWGWRLAGGIMWTRS